MPPEPSLIEPVFWTGALAIFVLLVLSAFFSGSETALTAASRAKLRAKADKGARGAQRALDITEDNERLIGSVLLGNNLVNILAASLATSLFTRAFGDSGVALATLVMTFLVLIFAEVLPKTYAITRPEAAAAQAAWPIHIIILVFSPIVGLVRFITRAILYIFGLRIAPGSQMLAVREEIAGAISLGHSEGNVEKEDRDRLLGALDLSERNVDEIMLHRSQIETVNIDLPASQVLEQCLQSAHTRLPVYRDNPENIIGIIHAKDLSRAMYDVQLSSINAENNSANAFRDFDVMSIATAPYFTPETTSLDDQMRQFLRRRAHFALVVDEYGSLQGLITLEDILEEIVGEITDEFDPEEEANVKPAEDGHYFVEGAMTIRDLNRANDWALPDDEANTVAGLVIHEARIIPAQGQVFSFHGYRFEVLERAANRITKLKIRPL